MSLPFVVIYGSQGSGKTTLAAQLATQAGLYFANLAADPRCAKGFTLWKIAFDLHLHNGMGKGLVSEGVLKSKASRDNFANRCYRELNKLGADLAKPIIIRLIERPEAMHQRAVARGTFRSVEACAALIAEHDPGSTMFRHFELPGDRIAALDHRVEWVLAKMGL